MEYAAKGIGPVNFYRYTTSSRKGVIADSFKIAGPNTFVIVRNEEIPCTPRQVAKIIRYKGEAYIEGDFGGVRIKCFGHKKNQPKGIDTIVPIVGEHV